VSKVNLKTAGGQADMQSFSIDQNMEKVDDIQNSNMVVMKIVGNETVEDKIIALRSDPTVEYSEPNYIYHTLSFNDSYS
jgi:hypothetical protein